MNSQRFSRLLLSALFISITVAFRAGQTSSLNGTWRLAEPSGKALVLTIADNYLTQTTYEPTRFISTTGGPYRQEGNQLNLLVEFDTTDSTQVGKTKPHQMALQTNRLIVSDPSGKQTFERVAETPTPLTGLWHITGRANEAGQVVDIMQRGPRKTIKLLTGGRFQWVAINPETKQFSGTGGGTYTLKDGKYTETIDFFSRDNSRVGRSLTFNAAVKPDEWLHSGQSSTGSPISERWSREK